MSYTTELYESKEAVSKFDWDELYTFLHSRVPHVVYALHFSYWRGQEEDIVEDVIQETMRRVLEQVQMAERGEAKQVRFPKHLSLVIASNYCRDMIRKDRRLLHIDENGYDLLSGRNQGECADGLDIATEEVYQCEVFTVFAREINVFPQKQRMALLIDLANRMFFDEQPTPLQEVFLALGVHLKGYKESLPTDSEGKKRYSALLAHAYRRVTALNKIAYLLEAS